MLIFDARTIGNKLLYFRKKAGLTQAEIAELAGLSDRAYADIERGNVNMRLDTLLRICKALQITPNDILTVEHSAAFSETELLGAINSCSPAEKQTAIHLLSVFSLFYVFR